MKSFPLPALIAAVLGFAALPFSAAAGSTLLLTAALGFIIHADYVQRRCAVRLPRRQRTEIPAHFRRLSVAHETHRLAA